MKLTRDYYQIVQVLDKYEYDFLQGGIPKFKSYITRDPTYVTFASKYVGRLDLLSYKVYGTPYLWWVIALANDIMDPFDQTAVGNLLMIPDIADVYDFYNAEYVSTEGF